MAFRKEWHVHPLPAPMGLAERLEMLMTEPGPGTPSNPRPVKNFLVSALTVILLTLGLLTTATPARAYQQTGFYSVPYSGTLYYHSTPYTFPASYSTWQNSGFPKPIPAPTDYVRYPWAPAIYAVSYFEGGWLWTQLAYDQWQRAGFPNPRIAGYIEGTYYHKWDTGSDIFATSPDNVVHKLSYREWVDSGYRQPEYRTNQGFQKLSWSNTISQMWSLTTGGGYKLTYADWAAEGFPSPQLVARYPGDRFCTYSWRSSSIITYDGRFEYRDINFNEWQAAGSPTPERCA